MSQKQTCANPNPQFAPATPLTAASILVNNPIVEPSALSRRDQNLTTLLKSLQFRTSIGQGNDVPKVLEEWIMS